jgi:hypothetical protein
LVDPADITPTLDRVGRVILPRTRENRLAGGSGGVVGTFTEHTVPTDEVAAQYVSDAASEVALLLGKPGTTWDGDLNEEAKGVVAKLAARDIEQAYGSEGTTISEVASNLTARYLESKDALLETAKNNQTGSARWGSIRCVTSQAVLDAEAEAEAEA